MRILKKWQAQLHDHFLNKQLGLSKRNQQTVSFDEAQLIGILFEATEIANRNLVLDYAERLKKMGKKVKLMAFLDEPEQLRMVLLECQSLAVEPLACCGCL